MNTVCLNTHLFLQTFVFKVTHFSIFVTFHLINKLKKNKHKLSAFVLFVNIYVTETLHFSFTSASLTIIMKDCTPMYIGNEVDQCVWNKT